MFTHIFILDRSLCLALELLCHSLYRPRTKMFEETLLYGTAAEADKNMLVFRRFDKSSP